MNTIPQIFFTPQGSSTKADQLAGAELAPVLIIRDPNDSSKIKNISLKELRENVTKVGEGLITLGVGKGDKVGIATGNSPEWIISDLAITSAGGVSVPVYTTLGTEEIVFILNDSEATHLIASPLVIKKITEVRDTLPRLKTIISTGEKFNDTDKTFEELKNLDKSKEAKAEFKSRIDSLTTEDIFSIIYTSGTTGRAKGVVLTHGNILSNIRATLEILDVSSKDSYLSYLPLSHVFERMVHHLMLHQRAPIAYSRGFAYVGADIALFKPSVLVGVPFFFKRLRSRILTGVSKASRVKRFLFNIATKWNTSNFFIAPLTDRVILKNLRDKIAPRLRFFVSGGAPLGEEMARFFSSLGFLILEGYGLTETSPAISFNRPCENRAGTVGKPLPGVDVIISKDSEILVKGPSVMKGYHKMENATKEAFCDGYFLTGDLGHFDSDGFLSITGRKKDTLITSTGKNISPQKIETLLTTDEFIKEALVYGDGRPHLVALIIPEQEKLQEIIDKLSLSELKTEEALKNKDLMSFFQKRIRDKLNGLARFEKLRNFALIEDTLTEDGGELTPTMKIKRSKVEAKFDKLLIGLYE
ncbi:MAG: long-chain fatty acid--CoA ligase [Deltaproteobacteria bacterium]|nr:long-chain fatty acid--CoA ligase [Deltaproteobacteria bacterium]